MTYTEDYINGVMEYQLRNMEVGTRERRVAALREASLNLFSAPCINAECKHCELSVMGEDGEVFCITLLVQEMKENAECGRFGCYVMP